MARKVFRVQRVGNRWRLSDEGSDDIPFAWLKPPRRTVSTHLRKEDAVLVGHDAALAGQPSRLVVMGDDEAPGFERTYGGDVGTSGI